MDWLPEDKMAGVLVGRAWIPSEGAGQPAGPSVVALRDDGVFDLSQAVPTMSGLLESTDPAALVRATPGRYIGSADSLFQNSQQPNGNADGPHFLAPCDLQVIKAAGVTFAASLVERVIEEQVKGDARQAEAVRGRVLELLGGSLASIKPGSAKAQQLKELLVRQGLWSQYLEVGIGPDAEVFTKGPVLSAVGTGAEVGIHPGSAWNNPEPEVVLAVNSRGEVQGVALVNDVNLRDFEGRSALLLGKAKDNIASCAIGPFIRLFDANFSLDDVRRCIVSLDVQGLDGFVMRGESSMSQISRDPLDLVRQTLGAHHQYPDGFMLFLSTMFAPTQDRGVAGSGFTHQVGDVVTISSPKLGRLVNTVNLCDRIAPWTFGLQAFFTNLMARGLLSGHCAKEFMKSRKPRIALVLGDPAGIGPELVARLLADPATAPAADLLLIADRTELEHGMAVAGCSTPYALAASIADADFSQGKPVLVDYRGETEGEFERRVSSAKGGRYCLDSLSLALEATMRGLTDAILFAPLNKHSLHQAGMRTSDELHWFVEQLGFDGPVCEFNVLDGLWTSRVTSHIAHREVAEQITHEGVTQGIELIHCELLRSGVAHPRIAVCGLNPHNGDNGSFGREEIDIIGPAVEAARSRGIPVEGPFAADTIFLKVQSEQCQYDAVVTMYHDQGQIAMKLMGFWRGITVQGGLPFPILTPAHGTAFDIAGQGIANPGAMLQAFQLACRMALARREQEAEQPLPEKIALVTGAGTGIGKQVALALMKGGFSVVLAGRRREPLEMVAQEGAASGAKSLVVTADVSDPASVKALFVSALETFGRLDLLVNNAGISSPAVPLEELSYEDWNKAIAINLSGVFLCTQEAFRIMKAQTPRGGRIINNGSIAATSPRPHAAAYAAAKHAVSGLTKAASLEGRAFNIACGQIDVGNAATDRTERMKTGVLQADGTLAVEPTMDASLVGSAVAYMASLPLDANVPFLTLMATTMPFIGRG